MSIRVSSDTYVQLFRRAALPGPGGALVSTLFNAPIQEFASLRVDDVDVPWQPNSVDAELSAWANVSAGELGDGKRVDGDVSIAFVRHRLDYVSFTLGRQIQVGGAARMCRFDGATVSLQSPFGLGADAYGGFAVLPRWSERPGYQLLGSAADSLLRTPDAIEQPSRAGSWLAGGRLHYSYDRLVELGASFHEQRTDSELDRRSLGIDAHTEPWSWIEASGQVLLDVDSWQPADGRAAVEVYPLSELRITAEYLHTVPALFLSRQSVLSVFSVDAFHEIGGAASYTPWAWLGLEAFGYGEIYAADSSAGLRVGGSARAAPFESELLVLRLGYTRVTEPENGYHALRVALGSTPVEPLRLTLESYLYLYDEPVRHAYTAAAVDTRFSWLGATTAEWRFIEWGSALLGGSIAVTPYALLDAQLLGRLRVDFAWEGKR